MWEFEIYNEKTKQYTIIFGYSIMDAFRRSPSLNPDEWECVRIDYID
jgi:hypothetical protein